MATCLRWAASSFARFSSMISVTRRLSVSSCSMRRSTSALRRSRSASALHQSYTPRNHVICFITIFFQQPGLTLGLDALDSLQHACCNGMPTPVIGTSWQDQTVSVRHAQRDQLIHAFADDGLGAFGGLFLDVGLHGCHPLAAIQNDAHDDTRMHI